MEKVDQHSIAMAIGHDAIAGAVRPSRNEAPSFVSVEAKTLARQANQLSLAALLGSQKLSNPDTRKRLESTTVAVPRHEKPNRGSLLDTIDTSFSAEAVLSAARADHVPETVLAAVEQLQDQEPRFRKAARAVGRFAVAAVARVSSVFAARKEAEVAPMASATDEPEAKPLPQPATPAVEKLDLNPEPLTGDAEAYYDGHSDEELKQIRSMLVGSLTESIVAFDDYKQYARRHHGIDVSEKKQRQEASLTHLQDFDRMSANLLALERVVSRRERGPNDPEPVRGKTPEGIIHPSRLSAVAVKQFADALFARHPDDIYGIVMQMRNSFNFGEQIPGVDHQDSLRTAERTTILNDVCRQLLIDDRPGSEENKRDLRTMLYL
ncbi:MAG TPA: hypothetical protein VLF69_04850 [Candidatus Saccharimonadales bacterium]|nr:hypothetical protein [Candidatus Saccharimonadales bacterium]